MTPPGDQLRQAIEGREAEQRRVDDASMRRTEVEARIDIRGSGETRAVVRFPVTFAEKPIMTFGGELDLNHTALAGQYPVISVMVDGNGWQINERGDGREYYTGCELLVVCLGKDTQRAVAHVLFKGLAFRGPTAGGRSGMGL